MTAYELIEKLKELPEDCEICARVNYLNWSTVINDRKPFSPVEHCEDDTPITWLECE